MAEFYVSFNWLDLRYIAHVVAPLRPAESHFSSYEDFHAAMDELGHAWEASCEIPHPFHLIDDESHVWSKQIAVAEVEVVVRSTTGLPGGNIR